MGKVRGARQVAGALDARPTGETARRANIPHFKVELELRALPLVLGLEPPDRLPPHRRGRGSRLRAIAIAVIRRR